MNIPITRPYFDGQELKKIKEVLDSGWVTQGPVTEQFETAFKQHQECRYAAAVSSCTAALHIALLALGIGKGDEVIVPAFTWITSASCVEYVGADVRFVDVEKETMNLDPALLEAAVTEKTKAVIAVHLFGNPAKMDEIMEIARRHRLYVIEDCACAVGTVYKGRKAGTMGEVGCFSFHPRKAVTTGEGGMCTTGDEKLYQRIRQLRNHGASATRRGEDFGRPYDMGIYDEIGYNLRLSDIQAAVGVAQLEKLSLLLEDRQRCAGYYVRRLAGNENVILPGSEAGCVHTWQSFVILLQSGDRELRNRIMDAMAEEGIQTRPGTVAVTRTEFNSKKYKLTHGSYPVAEYCEDASITLPVCPFMTDSEMDRVIEVIEKYL